MGYETLNFEIVGYTAWIRLTRNALNLGMANELMDAAWTCEQDDAVRVIVITGTDKTFSFGGDLKSFASGDEDISKHLKKVTVALHEAVSRFVRMQKPVIVGVNGVAAGAGMSLAMIGDLVIAAESAKFTMAYTNVGLTPDGSSSYFLPRLVGMKRALELTLMNRVLTATEAVEWGIATAVVPDEQLEEEVKKLATTICEGPVHAYGEAKSLLYKGYDQTLESQMALESDMISKRAGSQEGKEGISAFLEKRKASYVDIHEKHND